MISSKHFLPKKNVLLLTHQQSQVVDIPLDLEIKQLIFKDKNNLKNKRIKEAQTIKEKYIHKLRREIDKEIQRIIQEVKMKHGIDKIQNDLGRINDMFKNQVSLLLSNSR